jgi:ribosome-associated translation inhibitor RaiA
MGIDVRGLRVYPRLRIHITRRMSGVLGRRRIRPISARVTFSDEDGPRGGVGIRCALTVRLPGRPTIRVEHQARTYRQAFEGGFESLRRQLKRTTRRRWQSRRYPKKRFVTERLIEAHRAATAVRRRRTS